MNIVTYGRFVIIFFRELGCRDEKESEQLRLPENRHGESEPHTIV